MRKTILLPSLLLINIWLQAQDIVVLRNGDTLVGKISYVLEEYLMIKLKKYPDSKESKLPLNALLTYSKAYYNDTIKKVKKSDIIILYTGDTMKVRTVSYDENFYYYFSSTDNYELKRRIAKTSVARVDRKFYTDTVLYVTPSKSNREKMEMVEKHETVIANGFNKHPKRFARVGIDFGYYHRLGYPAANLKAIDYDYFNAMKNGLGLNLSVAYYFIPNLGLGFDYLYMNASSNGFVADLFNNPISGNASIVENINISHYCPYISFLVNLNDKRSIKYILNLGISYQKVQDAVEALNIEITGTTVGYMISNQFDFMINPNLAFGIRGDYSYGKVKDEIIKQSIYYPTTINTEVELNRLSFSVGFKFYIF